VVAKTDNLPARPGAPGFPELLERSRTQIRLLLPEHLDLDRVIRVALTAYRLSPEIRQCTPESILGAVMKACELGLEPGGALKQAWLVPFGRECTFQLSYFGMLDLARRSGQFRVIEARLVRERDDFAVLYTPEPELRHVPHLGPEPGVESHAYAYGRLFNGALVLEVMTRAEIEHVRQSSTCGPVWKKHWGEMAKKTVIKRLLKRQPCSVELSEAVEHDNRLDRGPVDAGRRPGPTRPADLIQSLEGPPEEPAFREGTAGQIRTEDAGDYDDCGDDDPGEAEPDRTEGT
jgi:recombination protein RecT